jgi:hypothetical protein
MGYGVQQHHQATLHRICFVGSVVGMSCMMSVLPLVSGRVAWEAIAAWHCATQHVVPLSATCGVQTQGGLYVP